MNQRLAFAAAAALALAAAPVMAQQPSSTTAQPPESSATPPADPGAAPAPPSTTAPPSGSTPSASDSGADASVTAGMSVVDNTGLTIGQVTEVKRGADGKETATIKMGSDTFAVETSNLAVKGQTAAVNATQAEIKQMLKK